ncbi:hypothetical protein QVD99_003386, partial [Batrachochytrium dendrobatidis]
MDPSYNLSPTRSPEAMDCPFQMDESLSTFDIQGVEHRLRKERIELRPRIQSRPMGLRRPPVLGFQIDGGSPPTVPP